ncbi:phage tail protein [Escherichia coli]|uniref:phage tail protein n=1 Tax=Escherichia coli TaxID=562 RepID=UPI0010CB1A60|nr:phage tail protein [Escherichia coli]MEB5674126.1 phage tail protein [Escherichia coli]GDD08480.1 phage tail protein [Escherichia coli]
MAENKIYAVLTDRGAQLEAAALASGVPVVLNKFVIGDANGNDDVTPDPARTALIHETYRGDIKSSENSGNQVIFTLYVPPETGGYTIREVGILTDKGELYSVARSPDILKPTDSNGALISITYKYTLAVSSTSTVNVVIDNSSGMSQADADKRYLQISKNLSEIKDKGESSQRAGRENLGIDLDKYYNKTEIDGKFSDIDEDINNINKTKPVLTVNNIQPDVDGNVNTGSGFAKPNGDGAFNLVSLVNSISLNGASAFSLIAGSDLVSTCIFRSSYTAGVEIKACYNLSGLWILLTSLTPSDGSIQDETLSAGIAQRVPIGTIAKFTNVKNPRHPDLINGMPSATANDYVNIECDIDGVGVGLTFTSYKNDAEEYSRQIYQNALAGVYGSMDFT